LRRQAAGQTHPLLLPRTLKYRSNVSSTAISRCLRFPFAKIEDGEKTARVGVSELPHAFDGLAFIAAAARPADQDMPKQRGERGKTKRS